MTVIEAGIIAGIPSGAMIGGMACHECKGLRVAAGSVAGMFVGGAAGWLYAVTVICLLSVAGALWRAARRDTHALAEADIKVMTPIATCGTLLGVLTALVLWLSVGWLHALTAAAAVGAATAIAAVARCELQ